MQLTSPIFACELRTQIRLTPQSAGSQHEASRTWSVQPSQPGSEDVCEFGQITKRPYGVRATMPSMARFGPIRSKLQQRRTGHWIQVTNLADTATGR
jgi:hypothetical protein